MPDALFGERVCVFVELRPGGALTFPELIEFLAEQGTSKENFPEHLVVLDRLPRSSGGKLAKGELATRARSLATPAGGDQDELGDAQRGTLHVVD